MADWQYEDGGPDENGPDDDSGEIRPMGLLESIDRDGNLAPPGTAAFRGKAASGGIAAPPGTNAFRGKGAMGEALQPHSFDLEYDDKAGTLTIRDAETGAAAKYPAGNNTDSRSRGDLGAGTYQYSYDKTHPDDSPDSAFGSYGISVFDVPGCVACGVHSGRVDTKDKKGRTGIEHATNGCVRTTDQGMAAIRNLQQNGNRINSLTVIR
jgi:hypothetical protein